MRTNTKTWALRLLASVALFVSIIPALPGQEQNASPDEKTTKKNKKKANPKLHYEFDNRPSLRAGEWLRVDLRVKTQNDFRSFDPEFVGDEGETSNLRRFRVGIEGYIHRDFEFVVERELRNEIADAFSMRTRETSALWRDVYGNFRYFRKFQLRGGQQKIPFGYDQINGTTNSEFVFRSLIGQFLAPGRAIGGMFHGKPLGDRLEYQAGLFLTDGHRAHLADGSEGGERTFAGRVVTLPTAWFSASKPPKMFDTLAIGAAFTESPVTEGLRSLRGRSWYDTYNYFDRINVRGHRLRLGTELNWTPGPFSVRGEFIRVRDQRLGQSLRGADLPNLISQGWYVSTSWVITGENRNDNILPKHPVHWGKGFGAFEIAARAEQLRFGSAEHPGTPSRSSRAANLFSTSERAATFGANWYLNRHMRITFNAIREQIEDLQNVPIKNVDVYWSRYVRMQFVL